jgi:hypothetical protein
MRDKQRSYRQSNFHAILGCIALVATTPAGVDAAPYASGVSFANPTTVNFILNEPADSLSVSINGGAPIVLDGSTKGLKTFNLNSASDRFSITATNNAALGYTIPTGNTIDAAPNGFSQPTAEGGYSLISDDANPLVRFNSPRGVAVATNPTNPQFGTAYISNSAAGTPPGRSIGDGLYAIRADQSDAFGYGDTAQAAGLGTVSSTNSPFRLTVGPDHNVYVSDFSDANGSVYRMDGTLTNGIQVLAGTGGPPTLPAGQNHGSTTAVFVTGSLSGGNLNVYTVDEDLTSAQFTPGGSTSDQNSLWRYDIGSSALPFSGAPTKINLTNPLLPLALSDMERGADGKFYLSQERTSGSEAGIVVLAPDGSVVFDSLTASRSLLGDPAALDIFRTIRGITVSLDQRFLAGVLNFSDVFVVPLDANGIPDITGRLLVNTPNDINSARDIAFDAAGNIHYVSSGQAVYRVLAPGGFTSSTTSWNGTSFAFISIPEPSSAMLLAAAALFVVRRSRGRSSY